MSDSPKKMSASFQNAVACSRLQPHHSHATPAALTSCLAMTITQQ